MPYADPAAKQAYQREWCARRYAADLAHIAALHHRPLACFQCGERDGVLVKHHPDKDTRQHKSTTSRRLAVREADNANCILLCANCHRRLHCDEKRKPLIHGTRNAYRAWGCRCPECRAGNAKRECKRRHGRDRRVDCS